jgi:hypothetical protein
MRCRHCLHAEELHDESEGFCNAKVYHSEALENASVPEHCDCPAFEPETDVIQSDEHNFKWLRRIHSLERLLEIEKRLLEEQGRRWSKRSRKLESRLTRELKNAEEIEQELDAGDTGDEGEGIPITQRDGAESPGRTSSSSRIAGESPDQSYDALKARLAELERAVATRRCGPLEFRIGAKGGVSVYGLARFPFTLYYEQWLRLLDARDRLREFLEESKKAGKLKLKNG